MKVKVKNNLILAEAESGAQLGNQLGTKHYLINSLHLLDSLTGEFRE